MNRLLLTGIGIVLLIVCGCSNKDRLSSGILKKEKMEAVLWDILQAERFTAAYVAKDSSKNIKTENFRLYSQVFAMHQVTKDAFIKSYKFYLSRPDIARVLFDSMAAKANRQREAMYKSQNQPAATDSVKSAQPAQPLSRDRSKDSLAAKTRRRRLITPGTKSPILKPDTGRNAQPLKRLRSANLHTGDTLLQQHR